MSHQLWTSPITGYRRRGTRLVELRSLLEVGITARAVLEPLRSGLIDAPAEAMADLMEKRGFDVAGVRGAPDGPVVGFVERASLQGGLVGDHVQRLAAEHLISDATALGSLLSILSSRAHVFVLIGPEVGGIVTRADLNKPPVRVYLFGLISLLEMHLGFWVRTSYPHEAWREAVKGARLEKAQELLTERHVGFQHHGTPAVQKHSPPGSRSRDALRV